MQRGGLNAGPPIAAPAAAQATALKARPAITNSHARSLAHYTDQSTNQTIKQSINKQVHPSNRKQMRLAVLQTPCPKAGLRLHNQLTMLNRNSIKPPKCPCVSSFYQTRGSLNGIREELTVALGCEFTTCLSQQTLSRLIVKCEK